MLSVELICVGKLKKGPLFDAWSEYAARLQWKLSLTELEGRSQAEELEKIKDKLDPQAALIVLDERGKSLPSQTFAAKIDEFQTRGHSRLQFVIGGADGLDDEIREKASLLVGFGNQTWPHMLARVMLLEQIYRAQQILAGHPYHRE